MHFMGEAGGKTIAGSDQNQTKHNKTVQNTGKSTPDLNLAQKNLTHRRLFTQEIGWNGMVGCGLVT